MEGNTQPRGSISRNDSISRAFLKTRAQSISADGMGRPINNVNGRTLVPQTPFQAIASSRRRTGRRSRLAILFSGERKKSNYDTANIPQTRNPSEETSSSKHSSMQSHLEEDGVLATFPEEKSTYFDRDDVSSSHQQISMSHPNAYPIHRSVSASSAYFAPAVSNTSAQSTRSDNNNNVWSLWPFHVFRNDHSPSMTASPSINSTYIHDHPTDVFSISETAAAVAESERLYNESLNAKRKGIKPKPIYKRVVSDPSIKKRENTCSDNSGRSQHSVKSNCSRDSRLSNRSSRSIRYSSGEEKLNDTVDLEAMREMSLKVKPSRSSSG